MACGGCAKRRKDMIKKINEALNQEKEHKEKGLDIPDTVTSVLEKYKPYVERQKYENALKIKDEFSKESKEVPEEVLAIIEDYREKNKRAVEQIEKLNAAKHELGRNRLVRMAEENMEITAIVDSIKTPRHRKAIKRRARIAKRNIKRLRDGEDIPKEEAKKMIDEYRDSLLHLKALQILEKRETKDNSENPQ